MDANNHFTEEQTPMKEAETQGDYFRIKQTFKEKICSRLVRHLTKASSLGTHLLHVCLILTPTYKHSSFKTAPFSLGSCLEETHQVKCVDPF